MKGKRKTALVICPGRGTYNKGELGYLQRYHANKKALIKGIDEYRQANNQPGISELDSASKFDLALHSRSDNASSLIYACAYADFLDIDQTQYEIVAITGNSMGWYIALACAGALNLAAAIELINSMGDTMQTQAGGQILIPLLDDNWQAIPGRKAEIKALQVDIHQQQGCELYDSILLGGYLILAGNDAALDSFMKSYNNKQAPPTRLPNHAAFHSPLMRAARDHARTQLKPDLFAQAKHPLIDGRGNIWQPLSSDPGALWDYTLGHQITRTYDFSKSIQVGVQEFAPDCLIVLGPGNTLGGACAQALIEINWQGLGSKQDFSQQQQNEPLLISMGLDEQRPRVLC